MILLPPRSTQSCSSAASDVYKRQERIVYDAFDLVRAKTGKDPLEVFDAAMKNVMPLLEVRARRVGGANYQVPVEVRADRKTTLGIRWLVNYSRLRGERTMCERVAGEIMDAANATGAAVKKREDTHKILSLIHISEPTRLGMISYAVFCLKKKKRDKA